MNVQKTPHIKIFVSAHKPSTFPDGASIIPIQVGAQNAGTLFEDTLHDNEGDNISTQNPMYCELTAQYWAWKNADADYYGFCHYRRYFDFTNTPHQENDYGEIMDSFIDAQSIAEYGLDDASIALAVDVMTSSLLRSTMCDVLADSAVSRITGMPTAIFVSKIYAICTTCLSSGIPTIQSMPMPC